MGLALNRVFPSEFVLGFFGIFFWILGRYGREAVSQWIFLALQCWWKFPFLFLT